MYTITKALLTKKRIELVNYTKFATTTLDSKKGLCSIRSFAESRNNSIPIL